jgi:hypothetical protein
MRIRYDDDAVDEQQLAKTTGFKEQKLRQLFKLEERSDLPAEHFEGAIRWLKSKQRHQGHRNAPPFTVGDTIIAVLRWDYPPRERQRIAEAIRYLEIAEEAIEPALQQLRIYGRNYLLALLHGRSERQKHWVKANRLAEDLNAELQWLAENEDGLLHSNDSTLREALDPRTSLGLFSIRLITRSRVVQYENLIDDGFPDATPRAYFQFKVLDQWVKLGGTVRISRHPHTQKIGGPLVRFYSAVTEPVIGGSPETLTHVVKAYKSWKAALDSWQLSMAIWNYDIP